jgi:hypothetical protein
MNIKEKLIKWTSKVKNFCSSKETVKKMEKQTEKIVAMYVYETELVPRLLLNS